MTPSMTQVMPRNGKIFLLLGLSSLLFLSACAGPTPIREVEFPIDCKKDQTVKDWLMRGDAHRNLLMRDKAADNTPPT